MAGYSGTPLAKKLGIGAGATILTIDAPAGYAQLLAPLPPEVTLARRLTTGVDVIHLFAARRATLARVLRRARHAMREDAALWVSWPKRASGMPTDITEDVIRAEALPLGYVDVKVCAVDDTWSGLKLVIRRSNRTQ